MTASASFKIARFVSDWVYGGWPPVGAKYLAVIVVPDQM